MQVKEIILLRNIKESLAITSTNLVIDEIIVGEIIGLSREILGREMNIQDNAEKNEAMILRVLETIISGVMTTDAPRLVKESIKEEANEYLNRKKNAVKNPLLRIIFDLCDEAAGELVPQIATQAVSEAVNEFLVERRCHKALGYIALEMFSDEFPQLIAEAIPEADLEIAQDTVISEVMMEVLEEDVAEVMGGLETDKRSAVRQDDMRIIGEHLKENMAKRMLLGHLMMSIANNFEEVQLEHQSRSVVRRFIAHRLLQLVTDAGNAMTSLKESKMARDVYCALSCGTIQELSIDAMVTASKGVLSGVDAQEARLAGMWARESRAKEEPPSQAMGMVTSNASSRASLGLI